MGTLDDGMEILIAELGDGMQLLSMIEELVHNTDTTEPVAAVILVGIVLAVFICLLTRWGSSDRP
jgi:hypothetical protein